MNSPESHWSDIAESTCAAGIFVLYGLHRVLGRGPIRPLLYAVAAYYWASRPLARKASMEYLRRMQAAHNAIGAPPRWWHGVKHFLSFAETLLDKLLAASGRYRAERLRFVGREAMDALLARGQGGVLLTAHVGCLELCQNIAARQNGLKLNVLVHTRHAERFNRILRRLDPGCPVKLLQVTEVDAGTAVMLGEKVAAGEFIAIAGDRVPLAASKTTQAEFLGNAAPFPVGAYVLAALFNCPLLLVACLRERDGHVVHLESLAQRVQLRRSYRTQQLAQLAALFAQRLEALLVRAPYEWFNFFPFWSQPTLAASHDSFPA